MAAIVLIVLAFVEGAIAVGVLYFLGASNGSGGGGAVDALKADLAKRREYVERFEALYAQMVDIVSLRQRAKELRAIEESLKAERGRITITQAELETVETRLRELEEIERELEASGIETKEELNILQKKHADLAQKNSTLKNQIAESVKQIDALFSEIEVSAQIKEQVQNMKTELLQTEQKIDELLLQIEQCNDQYFILKRRYDALDIEYAQLYEKFSEAEAMLAAKTE